MLENRVPLGELLDSEANIALAVKGNGQTSAVAAGAVDALAQTGKLEHVEAAFGDSGASYITAGAATGQTNTVRKVFERLCHYGIVNRSLGRIARCGVDLARAGHRTGEDTYPAVLDLDKLTAVLHGIFELERLAEEDSMEVTIFRTGLSDLTPEALSLNEYIRRFNEDERRAAALKVMQQGSHFPGVAGPPIEGKMDGGTLANPAMEAVNRGFKNVIYVNNFPADPNKNWFDSRFQVEVLKWMARQSGASAHDTQAAIAKHAAELTEFKGHLNNGGVVPQKDREGNIVGWSNVYVIRPEAVSYPGSAFLSRNPRKLRALSIAGSNAIYAALDMPEMKQAIPAPNQSAARVIIDLAARPFGRRDQTDQLTRPAEVA